MVESLYFAFYDKWQSLCDESAENYRYLIAFLFSVNEDECEDKLTPSVELTSYPNGSVITYIFIENKANGDHTLLVSKSKQENDKYVTFIVCW